MTIETFTIGAYGHSPESFFRALKLHGITLLVDVRQRRGMRGSKYAFANSVRLQSELRENRIDYIYLREMAPTDAVRAAQKAADRDSFIKKSDRLRLSDEFVMKYHDLVLQSLDLASIRSKIGGHSRVCFFCVERAPCACHRSLAANWLSIRCGKPSTDIIV